MNINGTNKADTIIANRLSIGADVIDARRGNDWIEGGAGNDVITTGAGFDTVVIRQGDGFDVIADFTPGVDQILADFDGSYSDVFGPFGGFYDGLTFTDFTGQTTVQVDAVDYNNDGIVDTMLTFNGNDGLILLGVAPTSLSSGDLSGG